MERQVLKFDDFNYCTKKYYLDQHNDIYFTIKTICSDIGHIQCFKAGEYYYNDWDISCFQMDDIEIRLMNYRQTGFVFSRHCSVRLVYKSCTILNLLPDPIQTQSLFLDKMLTTAPLTENLLNYDVKFESERYYLDEQTQTYFKLYVLTRDIGCIRCFDKDNVSLSPNFTCIQSNYGDEMFIDNELPFGFMFPRQSTIILTYKGHRVLKLSPQKQQLILWGNASE